MPVLVAQRVAAALEPFPNKVDPKVRRVDTICSPRAGRMIKGTGVPYLDTSVRLLV